MSFKMVIAEFHRAAKVEIEKLSNNTDERSATGEMPKSFTDQYPNYLVIGVGDVIVTMERLQNLLHEKREGISPTGDSDVRVSFVIIYSVCHD